MAKPIIQSRTYEGIKGTFKGVTYTVNGPEDMLEQSIALGGTYFDTHNTAWAGGRSKDVFTKATYGDDTYVKDVNEILEAIDATIDVQTASYTFDDQVSGITPNVPNAIMGIPESMVMMEPTQADFAPITLWVYSGMSAGSEQRDIVRRGAAITALVMKLQMIRPVMLKIVDAIPEGKQDHFSVCPIASRPLSLSQVSYILCHAGFARHTYGIIDKWAEAGQGDRIGWDNIFRAHGHNAQSPMLARDTIGFLGGDIEHDIYIPGLFLHDPLANDSINWIKTAIEKYRKPD